MDRSAIAAVGATPAWRRWPAVLLSLAAMGCDAAEPTPPRFASTSPSPEPVADARPAKQLLMHYMPWYETPAVRGRWGEHWTGWERQHDPGRLDAEGLPDLWSPYHPRIGPYDSADPDAIECHLLQMKLAGIDGVIVDWYGIADTADYPAIHEATRAVFEATGRMGMTFSVCFEDRTVGYLLDRGELGPAEVVDHLVETVRWMDAHWFAAPHYHKVDGRPLLLNFGPIVVDDAATWDAALSGVSPRPRFHALHHLWRGVGADGGFTWVHFDAWHDAAEGESIVERLREVYAYTSDVPGQVIASAVPGFRDVYADPHPVLDHREGETLRESLGAAMSGPWPIVQLVTWNDYGEGTMIEPTHEFGYRFLEIIQRARRDEPGYAMRHTADDLRLPARLYAARKAGAVSPPALDRVAALLVDGETAAAAEALRRVSDAGPAAGPPLHRSSPPDSDATP